MNKIQALYHSDPASSYLELFSNEQPPMDNHYFVSTDLMVELSATDYEGVGINIGCIMLYGPGKATREVNMRIAPLWQGKKLATVALERLFVEEFTRESTTQTIGFSGAPANPAITAIAYKFNAQTRASDPLSVGPYVSRERVEQAIHDRWSLV